MKNRHSFGRLGLCTLLCPLLHSNINNIAAAVPESPANPAPAWIYSWPAHFARVTWDPTPGAETYRLHRQDPTTLAWEAVATGVTNLMAFDLTAGSAGRTYRVTAVNSEGESLPSPEVTTQDSDYLPFFSYTPPGTYPGTLGPTSATLQWVVSLTSGADGMLELGTTLSNLTTVAYEPAYAFGYSVQVTNLSPATTYYFRVTGVGTNRVGSAFIQWFTTPDVNHPPVAGDITLDPVVDPWPVTVALVGADPNGLWTPLEFSIAAAPTNGTVSAVYFYDYWGPRYVDYTPNPGARGADFFQYVANDGELTSSPATISIPSLWLNRTPQPVSFTTNVLEDLPLVLTLQATDEDGDPLTFVFGGCLHGTVSGEPPNLVYTPAPEFSGSDLLLFNVNDGYLGGLAQGLINIEVQPANDPPVAVAQVVSTGEDIPATLTLGAIDPDSGALTFEVTDPPAHGSLSGTVPNLIYTPATNYSGPDSFSFRAGDDVSVGPIATIAVSVEPINDPPVAHPQTAAVPYNSSGVFTLSGSDADGDALAFVVLTSPSGGTMSGIAPQLIFTPAIGWTGTTTFTFRVGDGALSSAPATVTLTVAAPATVPPAPSGLTATAVSRNRINLAWTDNASTEDGFKVERSANGSSWSQIATVGPNVRNYASTGLSANKTYFYRVRAYNVRGNSTYSNTASARTLR